MQLFKTKEGIFCATISASVKVKSEKTLSVRKLDINAGGQFIEEEHPRPTEIVLDPSSQERGSIPCREAQLEKL